MINNDLFTYLNVESQMIIYMSAINQKLSFTHMLVVDIYGIIFLFGIVIANFNA